MVRSISLLVLRCADPSAAKRFYEAIGLAFQAERHGKGPDHWSCRVGDTVIEVYPAKRDEVSNVRLGFHVDDVAAVVRAALAAGGLLDRDSDGKGSPAVLVSPEGTKVEVSCPPARADI